MNPLPILIAEGVLRTNSSILIIGARDTGFARDLSEYTSGAITLLDKNILIDMQDLFPQCTFVNKPLETFVPDQNYDIVICTNTLPFTEDIWLALNKVLSFGNVCLFNLFSTHHEWQHLKIVSRPEAEKFLQERTDLKILYKSDYEGRALSYRNNHFHQHCLLYVTKKA